MTDALLSVQDREEALSRVYMRAVAAYAGYTTSDNDFDRDGVDLRVHAGGAMRPAIDLQLKATINLAADQDDHYRFPMPRRNYDLLRAKTLTPRLLAVLDLPKDENDWMTITTEELILRRCAYWLSLKDCPERDNTSSVTVYIPKTNVLDVEGLRVLMERSRQGGI